MAFVIFRERMLPQSLNDSDSDSHLTVLTETENNLVVDENWVIAEMALRGAVEERIKIQVALILQ